VRYRTTALSVRLHLFNAMRVNQIDALCEPVASARPTHSAPVSRGGACHGCTVSQHQTAQQEPLAA